MVDLDKIEWETVTYDKDGNPQLERPSTELENLCHICRMPQQMFLNANNECHKCSQKRQKSDELRKKGETS